MPQPHHADARRLVPRTDAVLADPAVAQAVSRLGRDVVRGVVRTVQGRVRDGEIGPDDVVAATLAALPERVMSLTPVLNATGVVIHTNLGRAPLSHAAIEAMRAAAGTVDVELDLATGRRSRRGAGAIAALLELLPEAGAALVVNNGAAALVLATTALAAGREVVVSRGEMVEIGDGFRLPDLIASTGARLREVGTTNRTTLADYAQAVGPDTGCILKVHPSNFRVDGFTASVDVAALVALGPPVVHDIGSGLLRPHRLLPDEPDAARSLRDGAAVVTCSGDKVLGGPQAGLVLGRAETVERLRRHPLARAVRADKTTLAALEATVRGPRPPVWDALEADPARLRERCDALVAGLPVRVGAETVPSDGVVGGGGAPGVMLPGWAVALPEAYAAALRAQARPVLARVERGRALVDLRCIPEDSDTLVLQAIAAVRP
ncbi:L-seryl-tRNA(Sec) selenium transferase [Nostocoides sp. HKS02]|uniref:L-seryl-tRNA(Sec) selenium transferase n=1 Tax=Nostocoides sp. HKS02 TaxID=1813880 RepID=UPI0012B4B93E|nr:L-seryl-tRNA(Sec) selenium transferase [Tetrasphaera sp. HKS02]QGN58635.1 L-seryl-tRNA(Sec) selenium transferase [Tetrasphaera sp. HKS02]